MNASCMDGRTGAPCAAPKRRVTGRAPVGYLSRRSAFTVMSAVALLVAAAVAQTVAPTNSDPNPYRAGEPWGELPQGRAWGSTGGVAIDVDGRSVWVAERCSQQGFVPPSEMRPGVSFACDGSNLDPILKFDASGGLVKSFGAGLFVFPHGIYVDREDNIWVTDGLGRNGKGHQVIKFSPDGQVLLRLGKAGVAGHGAEEFNAPSAVVTAPDGDIFVADGHGGDTNARVVKFAKDGKFIKTWGKRGSAPGQFDVPHTITIDRQGRLLVGDRNNNRIQFFDQDGKFLDQWMQFSRPSSIVIDNDNIYVADSESESVARNHDGWKRGIRIGRLADGVVTGFIPDPVEKIRGTSAAEGIAVDSAGNIFGAEVGNKRVVKYVRK
jgi:streptogramin lyase